VPVVRLLLHLFTLPTLLPMVQETKRKAMALTEAEIDELRYTRVKALKKKGYVRLQTNKGNLNLEVCLVTCARPQTFHHLVNSLHTTADCMRHCAQNIRELHWPLPQGVLQQRDLPPSHQELYGVHAWLACRGFDEAHGVIINHRSKAGTQQAPGEAVKACGVASSRMSFTTSW